jgi:hypothetical protein
MLSVHLDGIELGLPRAARDRAPRRRRPRDRALAGNALGMVVTRDDGCVLGARVVASAANSPPCASTRNAI